MGTIILRTRTRVREIETTANMITRSLVLSSKVKFGETVRLSYIWSETQTQEGNFCLFSHIS